MSQVFGVTFQGFTARKSIISPEMIAQAKSFYKTTSLKKISNPDLQLFKNESEADKFISSFNAEASKLDKLATFDAGIHSGSLLSKRHHLVLLKLGLKMKQSDAKKYKNTLLVTSSCFTTRLTALWLS